MKAFLPLLFIVSISAHANITCKGAVKYAVEEGKAINGMMLYMETDFDEVLEWSQSTAGRLGDVKLGCAVKFDAKEDFCTEIPYQLKERAVMISQNVRFTDKQRVKLLNLNSLNQVKASDLCGF